MVGLPVRALLLVAWLVALPWRLLRRWVGRARPGTWLSVTLDGGADEAPARSRWWPGLSGKARPRSIFDLRRRLDAAARDANVLGVVVVLRSIGGGMASATAVRAALSRVRAAGKRAVVYLPLGGGLRETLVAMTADRVLLAPHATLAPVGLLSVARYVRGALDRAGVTPEVHARGKYKTAAERLARGSMSEAQREQVEAILDGSFEEAVRGIAEGRGVPAARARGLLDGAPYFGAEAVDAGLVDALAHEDALPLALAPVGEPPAKIVSLDRWWSARAGLAPRALHGRDVIAVLRIHGAIAGEPFLPFRDVAVDDRVIAAVRRARLSPRIRAVVVHVDSPGGSALASARMHHELAQLAAEKPLIASMGNVAASGGYYVAVAAEAIVARPLTITGSIGVIGARLVLEPLLGRLGVLTEVLHRGEHARLLDPLLPLREEDRAAVDREIERTYESFLAAVARGRKRAPDEIRPHAEGRVWTGADALARGLVDRLGGLEDAIDLARERLGRGGARMRVVTLPFPRGDVPPLAPPERTAAAALAMALEAAGLECAALAATQRDRVLAWCSVAASLRL